MKKYWCWEERPHIDLIKGIKEVASFVARQKTATAVVIALIAGIIVYILELVLYILYWITLPVAFVNELCRN